MPATFWDERYGADDYVYGTAPNAFLTAEAARLPAGAAVLLPADGEGRNGVWLAERGMAVTTVDGSAVGVAKARRLAAERKVAIDAQVADLNHWAWPTERFDAVISLFLHLDPAQRLVLHRKMAEALKPGGLILLEAFRPEQLANSSGGPKDARFLYRRGDLAADFAALDILRLEEVSYALSEGRFHSGPAATVQLVARKSAC